MCAYGLPLVHVHSVEADALRSTQLAFHPTTQHLYVANRQSDDIVCYDLRHAAEPVRSFSRPGRTNQRLFFGLDATGQVLASGDQVGWLRVKSGRRCHADPFYSMAWFICGSFNTTTPSLSRASAASKRRKVCF